MPDEEQSSKKGWFGGDQVPPEARKPRGWFGGELLSPEERAREAQANKEPSPTSDPDAPEFHTIRELADAWGVEPRVVVAEISARRIPMVDTAEGPRIPHHAFEAAVAHGRPTIENPLPRPRSPQKRRDK